MYLTCSDSHLIWVSVWKETFTFHASFRVQRKSYLEFSLQWSGEFNVKFLLSGNWILQKVNSFFSKYFSFFQPWSQIFGSRGIRRGKVLQLAIVLWKWKRWQFEWILIMASPILVCTLLKLTLMLSLWVSRSMMTSRLTTWPTWEISVKEEVKVNFYSNWVSKHPVFKRQYRPENSPFASFWI